MLLHRLVEIAREAIPSVDLIVKSTIRAFMGVAALFLSGHVDAALAHWVEFAGKMFIMLAVIGLFSHVEGTLNKHIAAKLKLEGGKVWNAWRRWSPLSIAGATTEKPRADGTPNA